jgi:hypothetical protein
MIRQASDSEWNERAYSFWLCQLPLLPEDIHARWGIEFEDYIEDGLGPHKGALVVADGVACALTAPTGGPLEISSVTVQVQSHEPDTRVCLAAVLAAFGPDRASLLWENEFVGPARWAVIRIEADEREIEIGRYQMDVSALSVARNFERDFGQKCVVRCVE